MVRAAMSLAILISLGGCPNNSSQAPNDPATTGTGGDSHGSGGQASTADGTGGQPETGGAHSNTTDAATAMDAADGSMNSNGGTDASTPPNGDVGSFCGGFAGFTCNSGLVCIDDPRDDCDPKNGGADCGGICVRDALCGGFAAIACGAAESCVDDPRDDCDPQNGGADCGGLCLPQGVLTACAESDCAGPAPAAPNMLCDDGTTVAGPACLRNDAATCTWQIVSCPSTAACHTSGCSGEVCATGDVVTDCVYQPKFDCLKHSECGAYGPGGTCAWKDTAAYQNCLNAL